MRSHCSLAGKQLASFFLIVTDIVIFFGPLMAGRPASLRCLSCLKWRLSTECWLRSLRTSTFYFVEIASSALGGGGKDTIPPLEVQDGFEEHLRPS